MSFIFKYSIIWLFKTIFVFISMFFVLSFAIYKYQIKPQRRFRNILFKWFYHHLHFMLLNIVVSIMISNLAILKLSLLDILFIKINLLSRFIFKTFSCSNKLWDYLIFCKMNLKPYLLIYLIWLRTLITCYQNHALM